MDVSYWLRFFLEKMVAPKLTHLYMIITTPPSLSPYKSLLDKGISVDFITYASSNLLCNGELFDPSTITNEPTSLLLVMYYDASLLHQLAASGLQNGVHYYCLFDNQIILKKLDHLYEDQYGNHIHTETAITNTSIILEGFHNHITIGKNNIFNGATLLCKGNTSIVIGDNNNFSSSLITVYPDGTLSIHDKNRFPSTSLFVDKYATISIHDNSHTGNDSVIRARYNGTIRIANRLETDRDVRIYAPLNSRLTIGCDCLFSWNINLIASNGHSILDLESKKNLSTQKASELTIGNHVWIGMGTQVLASNIRDNSVIGAGSVVKGSFPTNCILAGNPAKIKRTKVDWNGNDGISYEAYTNQQRNHPHYALLGYSEQLREIPYAPCSLSYSLSTKLTKQEHCTSIVFQVKPSCTYIFHTNGLHTKCYATGFLQDPRTCDVLSNTTFVSLPTECLIPSSYLGYLNSYNISFETNSTTKYMLLCLDDRDKPLKDFEFQLFECYF